MLAERCSPDAVDYGNMPMRPPPPPPPPAPLGGLHGMLPGGNGGALLPLHGLPRLGNLPPNGYGGMMMPNQDAPQHGNSAFPALQVRPLHGGAVGWARIRADFPYRPLSGAARPDSL